MNSRVRELDPDVRRIIVLGDLHGSIEALQAALAYWRSLRGAPIVLLGDYADRGPGGVEILEAMIDLAREKEVIALKGNHEDYSPAGNPLFQPWSLGEEVERKRGPWLPYFQARLKPFFDGLCLAALLPGKIIFVHGGVSSRVTGLDSLRSPSPALERDVLWSDPTELPGERPSPRGAGVEFGPDITHRVLQGLGVSLLLRSHQPDMANNGLHRSQGGQVITLSATDCYGGRPFFLEIDNQGGQPEFAVHFV